MQTIEQRKPLRARASSQRKPARKPTSRANKTAHSVLRVRSVAAQARLPLELLLRGHVFLLAQPGVHANHGYGNHVTRHGDCTFSDRV